MSDYPESERLHKVSGDVSTLHEFLEWTRSEGLILCRLQDTGRIRFDAPVEEYFPSYESMQDLIYRFFEIDDDKLERERRAMLEELRTSNESAV